MPINSGSRNHRPAQGYSLTKPAGSSWTGAATGASRVVWSPGTLQRGRVHSEEEGRQAFWRGSPTSPSSPFSFSLCFLFSCSSALLQCQTRRQGWDPTLSRQVLSSCSSMSKPASHLWDSVSKIIFKLILRRLHGAVLARMHGLCWNCPESAHGRDGPPFSRAGPGPGTQASP